MKSIGLFLLLLWVAIPAASQKVDPTGGTHYLTGKVTDIAGRPMSWINLDVRKGDSDLIFHTGLDGKFNIALKPGSYEIEVNKTNSRTFHAFISITAEGPNPDDVTFVLDPDDACCVFADGSRYPKPIVLPRPPYPAAARAVRAAGEVEIEVVVESDGTVSSATARSGHPLLRSASLLAARAAKFEPSPADGKRSLVLTFVFLGESDATKDTMRYENAYRIEIVAPALTVDY
jgi:TonB family protein